MKIPQIFLLIIAQITLIFNFQFASLSINADSKIINTITTYQIDFDRSQDDNLQPTAYLTNFIRPTDTVTVTFPAPYVLSSVTCIASVNSGNQFNPACGVSGNSVVISNIVSTNTAIAKISVWISNILNPSPAIVTDYFTGTIGTDTSGPGTFASNLILQPATFTSCYSTFSPSTVNSTSNMIITLTPKNQIPSTGYIVINFPIGRRWSNDISTTNFMPFATSMSCSNRSANVLSTLQCTGYTNQASVTATNLFSTPISSQFSFSINNFLSPPTNQQIDALSATSYSSTGDQIDTCTFYISDLTPKPINSIFITNNVGNTSLTVNLFYTLRFTFTLTDTLAQTDTLTVVFPTGSVVNFNSATVTSTFSNAVASSSFQPASMTLFVSLTSQGRTFPSGTVLSFSVGSYQAPPSIQTSSTFLVTFYRNNFKKLQGTATVTAVQSTLSGSVSSIASTTVNANTSYTFQITTIDPISSNGKIKITLPSTISILATSPSCATITGNNTATNPICAYNLTQNSITLSSINSSASIIPAQSLTITISGIRNPASIRQSSGFVVSTYYRSTDSSLVATGTISGITATTASISNSFVTVTPSSTVVNEISTTYSLKYTVNQPIPSGGYFIIFIPSEIGIDVASLPNSCSVNLNSTSFTSTPCTVLAVTGGYQVNFTNPLIVDATLGTQILARISSVFTNPSSTRPTSSFRLSTFHSNGFAIANINSALTVQMTTPTNFDTITISRLSNKNYQLTTYTFSLTQKSLFEASSVILITFPSNIFISGTPVCSLTSPASSSLTCSYSSLVLKVTLPNSSYSSGSLIRFTVTNVRNPPSFQPLGVFTFESKTANQLYSYSLQTHSSSLTNTIATSFSSIAYQFTPAVYGEPVSLQINFTLTNSRLPTKIRLSLANSFTIGTLSCNSFIDFTGTCTLFAPNTIEITGTFNNAPMSFSVTGLTTPTTAPLDYSSMVSFDSNDYKIDESSSAIIFNVVCTMPCRTCQSLSLLSSCTSCYTSTTITNMIFFDSTLKKCESSCTSGKYADSVTKTCNPCDTNCLTCNNSATYCLSCNSTSQFKYLFANTSATPNTQTCLSACPNQMYSDSTNSNICTACVSPCVTCTSAAACTSCITGRYLLNSSCGTTCPSSLYVPNPTTKVCDPCDSSCATCQIIVTNCTSCNSPLLIYQNQCRTTCPTPLVPQNGTCGPCDNSCLTCENTPFNCTSCDTNSSLAYLHNNKCLSTCPQTYYKNIGLGVCSLCSSVSNLNCSNCSSVSTCYTCNVGFVLYNQNCLNYVPTGFVNISGVAYACTGDCATCSITTSNCTSCKNYNLLNFTCYQTCPAGYIGISKICQLCTSPCKTCSNTVTNCTSCDSLLSPSVYLSNSVCVRTCPDSTYAYSINNTCLNCVTPCQFCSSSTICLTCLNGFFFFNSSCLTSCPSGYAGVNRICKLCQGNCATCLSQTTLCITCKPNTYLFQLNNSCVSSCGNGLYVDLASQKCIYCTAPCKTCQNTSSTCLSCLTGSLYNYQCVSVCPDKSFDQSGLCVDCPTACSACTSLTSCNSCVNSYLLYNGFCITTCPDTHAVVVSQVCTACSGSNCHQCTPSDVCTMCNNQFSLLNGACLGSCPSGYKTNGTHCIDLTQQSLTTPTSFPVPFSIAAAVIIIACLMSKLQYSKTFLPGAVFAFIGLLQTGALAFFLSLYFTNFFAGQPLPFYIGIAALCYLIVLNIIAFIVQNLIFCNDKLYALWNSHTPNKCSTFWVNFISLAVNHKFRNILFCKLFTFTIFTSQLESVTKFKVINIFSFLSLIHSGAAIFAVCIAVGFAQKNSQLYYQCIDVIVVTSLNAILAFFNVMKPHDFFYEMTPQGFQLKKKINAQETYYESNGKILPAGRQQQDQQGYTSIIYHVSQGNLSKQPLNTGLTTTNPYNRTKYNPYQVQQIPDQSYGSLVDPTKQLQDISIQAVQMIDDTLFQDPQQNFDITAIPPPGHQKVEQTSNYTTIFKYSDKGVGVSRYSNSQIGIQNTIDHGPQVQDASIQPSVKKLVDQSVQRYSTFDPVDRSVQKTVFFKQDQSMQYAQSMKSKAPSLRDKSTSNAKISVKDKSIQQIRSQANKSQMFEPSVRNQSIQKSTIQKKDQAIQNHPQQTEQQIQAVQQQSQKGNQKSISKNQISIQYIQDNQDKSVQHQNIMQFDQYNQDIAPSKNSQTGDKVIFEQTIQEQSPRNKQLKQQQKDQFLLPKQQIKSYQEQLQQRIREKQQELNKIKRKIEIQQRKNQQKQKAQVLSKENMKRPRFIDQAHQVLNIKQQKQREKEKDRSMDNREDAHRNRDNIDGNTVNISEQQSKIIIQEQSLPNNRTKLNKNPNQNTNSNSLNSKILKKQTKQIQQQPYTQLDKTLQQIQIINDQSQKQKQKSARNKISDNSKITQQQFIGMLEEHPSKVIFENSSQVNEEDQLQNNNKRDNAKQQYQYNQKLSKQINQQQSKFNIFQNSQADRSRSRSNSNSYNYNQLGKVYKKQPVKFIQSQAEISSVKDGSTKIYSSIRPINANHKRVNSTKQNNNNNNGNFNLQDSQDYSFDPIINRPIQAYNPHTFSEMSQTIQQLQPYPNPRHTKQSPSENLNRTSQLASSHLKNQQIKNKIRESLPHNMRARNKKQIPNDRQQQQIGRKKFQLSNSNAVISQAHKIQSNPGNNSQDNNRLGRRSSLLMAGKSQFTQQGLARKQLIQANPLKTTKRWSFENQDKNIEQSGGEQQIKNIRTNLTHYVNPLQTDKSALQFKSSGVVQYKQKQKVIDQISPFIGQMKTSEMPTKPRFQFRNSQKKDLSQQNSSQYKHSLHSHAFNLNPNTPYNYNEQPSYNHNQTSSEMDNYYGIEHKQPQPYIQQQSEVDYANMYKNQIMLGQMLHRPENGELKTYYNQHNRSNNRNNKNNRSRQKNSNVESDKQRQFLSQTQKIYLQRLDHNSHKKR